MILPSEIRPGETVGVVSPSGPFEPERLQPALRYLSDRGYRVREGRSLHARERYLAGSDAARADELNAMFIDTEVRAIFAARGGYGSGWRRVRSSSRENTPPLVVVAPVTGTARRRIMPGLFLAPMTPAGRFVFTQPGRLRYIHSMPFSDRFPRTPLGVSRTSLSVGMNPSPSDTRPKSRLRLRTSLPSESCSRGKLGAGKGRGGSCGGVEVARASCP